MSGAAVSQAMEALDSFALPSPVTDAEVMFGGRLEALLPPYETLPAAFRDEQDAYSPVVWQWYFRVSGFDCVPALDPGSGIAL